MIFNPCVMCREPFPKDSATAPYCSTACAEQLERRAFTRIVGTQSLTTAEFEELLHTPTLRDWAREVVWRTSCRRQPARYDFIVAEDYTLVDRQYHQFHLPKTWVYALRRPHPIWLEILWELEVIPVNFKQALTWAECGLVQHEWLLRHLSRNPSPYIRSNIMRNSRLPLEILSRMINDPSPMVRQMLLRLSTLPAELVEQLVQDQDRSVRWSVALHQALSPAAMLKLAQDQEVSVRAALARNPLLSAECIAMLIQDADHHVLRVIADHPRLPEADLLRWANDPDDALRSIVAVKITTAREVLAQFIHDPSEHVRYKLLQNRNLPLELLEQLTHDSDTSIARYALEMLKKRRV